MKKYLTYRSDGIVINVSESKNQIAKHLICKEFEIDEIKEEQNWNRKIIDNKLIYEKPSQIEQQEKLVKIKKIKEDINSAETLEETKEQIKQLVELI